MLTLIEAIVLYKIKYGENDLICYTYSKAHGYICFILKNAFSKKAKSKSVHFLPLSHVEIISYLKKSSLSIIRESKIIYPYKSLYSQKEKIQMVFFLSEFLNKVLKEEPPNNELFSFITYSLTLLDNKESNFADFHLFFILNLSKYLGFPPSIEEENLEFFCLKDGQFKRHYFDFCLDKKESLLFKKLIFLNFEDSINQFNYIQRQELIAILLRYFSFHLKEIKEMKSLMVLKNL